MPLLADLVILATIGWSKRPLRLCLHFSLWDTALNALKSVEFAALYFWYRERLRLLSLDILNRI